MRRRVEGLACPISGASGVRAQFYPHQVQNVQRILTSNRIHHLIADEVGMGKTIQALMIANALRLQKKKLRVRIVVPHSELQTQWINEVACRAQCTAELGRETVGDDWFDVVDESNMLKPSETLDPTSLDLLILDEPQSLKQDTLRFVAANSADFPRVLLLTASPNLRDIRRLLELLQMLEPERVERARREADNSQEHEELNWSRSRIGDLDDAALQLVFNRYLSHCAKVVNRRIDTSEIPFGASANYRSFAEHRRIRIVSETRWMYRNVLRSYRSNFPDHLPRREPKRLIIEPTSEEAERMELAESYVAQFLETYQEPQHLGIAAALLHRTSLGGRSLQERLRQLRRGDSEHEPRLGRINDLSRRDVADSRLDCLVDWLVKFWLSDPTRKVVIAAEDNVTIEELNEELAWRIPEVGSRAGRIPLEIVTALDDRRLADATEDDHESQTLKNLASSQLRAFEESKSQLLLAHHVFRQSYNLQTADALIFYALPWKPEDVDQWIGRVDRLGWDFVDPERPSSRPKPVRILTIHRHGDPTIQVQEVLDEYHIFETAIDPERKLLEQISSRIERVALPFRRNVANGSCSSGASEIDDAMDTEYDRDDSIQFDGQGKVTEVPAGSHWTVDQAIQLHNIVARPDDFGPVLRQTRQMGYVTSKSEQALAKWLAMLRNHKLVNAATFKGEKQADGRRSRTYYTVGQDERANPKLSSLQDRKHRFLPFFIARGNIQRPPRIEVNTSFSDSDPKYEPLQFLSFGSTLHADLVETYERAGKTTSPLCLTILSLGQRYYPEGTELQPGTYLCGAGYVDSAFMYSVADAAQVLLVGLPDTSGARRSFMRDRALANFTAGLEADARFVRILRRASMNLFAWVVGSDNRLTQCSAETATDLFSGQWSKKERPNYEPKSVPAQYGQQLVSLLRQQIAVHTKGNWTIDSNVIIERFEERKEIIRIDAEDSLWVLRSTMQEVQSAIDELVANPSDQNEQRLQLNYRPQMRQLEEESMLIERARDARLSLLDATLSHFNSPVSESVNIQCTAVIRLESDPVPPPPEHEEPANQSTEEFAATSTDDTDNEANKLPNKPR